MIGIILPIQFMITYHFVVFMMQILLAFELTNKGELGKKGEIMEEEGGFLEMKGGCSRRRTMREAYGV